MNDQKIMKNEVKLNKSAQNFVHRGDPGQAMLIAILFFLFISLTIILGIATPILKQVKISEDLLQSKKSYYVTEGALEDAMYRVKTGETVVSGEVVTLNGYTSTITLTTASNGETIDTSSNLNGDVRKMESSLTEGTGEDFNYGVQAGSGGFNMSGGSTLNGNIYSDGSIWATSATITGTAIAADPISTTTDQSNATPVPISSCTSSTCITFGNASASQDVAESFTVSQGAPLSAVAFYIKKVGNPANITVRIVSDNNSKPSAATLLTGTLSGSSIGTGFAWATSTITTTVPILDPTQTYWIVLDNGTQSSSNYYIIGANSSYANGTSQIGQYGGTWTNTNPAGLDLYFQTFLGGGYSTIGGGSHVGAVNIGSGSTGNAWAHTVTGANVAGTLYCQNGSNNNKSCNTSQSDPPAVGLPVSNANVTSWENSVTSGLTTNFSGGGTYTGNLTINYLGTTSTLSEVNGNLTLQCSSAPANFGNLYVTGSVTISSGCQMNASSLKVGGTLTVQTTGLTVGALEVDGTGSSPALEVTSGGLLKAGPIYVAGNSDIQSTLDLLGTFWTAGTLSADSGSTVELDPTYGANSGVILSNSYVSISDGSLFKGSGNSVSFPMVVTTSDCPVSNYCNGNDAINMGGGAGAVVLDAQNGTLNMTGGTGAEALTANEIIMSNGVNITYNSGLANLNFSSGPSGGWQISTWKEVQ